MDLLSLLSLRPRTSGLLAQLIQADTKEPKKDLDEEMKSCDNNMRKFNHSYIREASELKDVTISGKSLKGGEGSAPRIKMSTIQNVGGRPDFHVFPKCKYRL